MKLNKNGGKLKSDKKLIIGVFGTLFILGLFSIDSVQAQEKCEPLYKKQINSLYPNLGALSGWVI